MIEPYTLGTIANAGATMLADSIVVGSIVAFVACAVNVMFRHRGAAVRFGVLMAALMATASLPVLRLWSSKAGVANGTTSLLHFAGAWAPWILGAWATMATVALSRVAFGLWTLRRLRRECRKADERLLVPAVREALVTDCRARRVELLISPRATVPAAIGFFRPAVVLPAWVVQEMSAEELGQIVTHELSHLRRYDDWTNLVQKIVKALLFFHPAVWWMESRMSLEREMACDDAVLTRTANARAYAECLARMAEKTFLRRGLAMAQAAVSRVRQTSRRVARILQADNTRAAGMGKVSAVMATTLVASAIGIAYRTPLLLSFGGSQAAVMARVVKPEVAEPVTRPIQAAWRDARSTEAKPTGRPAVRKAVARRPAVPQVQTRPLLASMRGNESVTRSILIVVVQDGDGVAVWRITTWHYSPSEQVRAARKTT